ncbi:hypothetical protein MTR_7g063500 [Medicago truncatula]|uniref:Uncharacterized protein n=1 Tax=Medicago truncatula TaxID=3880 RepID=A0A072TZQ3_MEDTR|nr:hypothetical protein MTR_7g063500 [Medicago truncatula]
MVSFQSMVDRVIGSNVSAGQVHGYYRMELFGFRQPEHDILVWTNTHCRKLKSEIEDCHRQLQLLRGNNAGSMQSELLEMRKKIQRLLTQDDAYWKHRAQTHWYKYGDRNTKFFHAYATARKKGRSNSIS